MGIFKRSFPLKKKNCPHEKDSIRNIYGDEILVANARSRCMDCGTFFNGLNGRN